MQTADPDIVFHLAAQAMVRTGYASPRETFEVNVIGTAAVLDAVRAPRQALRRGSHNERQVLR